MKPRISINRFLDKLEDLHFETQVMFLIEHFGIRRQVENLNSEEINQLEDKLIHELVNESQTKHIALIEIYADNPDDAKEILDDLLEESSTHKVLNVFRTGKWYYKKRDNN